MTVKEFFASVGQIAIHCDTEEKAKKLLKAFDDKGYRWCDGKKYTNKTYWAEYKEETCYSNCNCYCYKDFYQRKGRKVIEFEEIDIN